MQIVILAGGRGTRLAEETTIRPKPMVEIGGKPMLWHIMNIYAFYGFKNFLVACGYKGEIIKEYFHNFFIHHSDYVINLSDRSMEIVNANRLDWRVGAIDTGLDAMTGGRVLALKRLIGNETFSVTYGDSLGNVNVRALVEFHRSHGKLATVTAVRPPARFGELILEGDNVREFREKPQTGEGWINGGFFVFEPGVFDYLTDDQTVLEREPLERLAAERQLIAFQHSGFWKCMDTYKDNLEFNQLWDAGEAEWKVWD